MVSTTACASRLGGGPGRGGDFRAPHPRPGTGRGYEAVRENSAVIAEFLSEGDLWLCWSTRWARAGLFGEIGAGKRDVVNPARKDSKLAVADISSWARVRVPDYEIRRDAKNARGFCRTSPDDDVDICIMPRYAPRYESKTMFHWMYQVAYRGPGSSWPNYESPRGCWISPWDFGLIDASTNSPNWDKAQRGTQESGNEQDAVALRLTGEHGAAPTIRARPPRQFRPEPVMMVRER